MQSASPGWRGDAPRRLPRGPPEPTLSTTHTRLPGRDPLLRHPLTLDPCPLPRAEPSHPWILTRAVPGTRTAHRRPHRAAQPAGAAAKAPSLELLQPPQPPPLESLPPQQLRQLSDPPPTGPSTPPARPVFLPPRPIGHSGCQVSSDWSSLTSFRSSRPRRAQNSPPASLGGAERRSSTSLPSHSLRFTRSAEPEGVPGLSIGGTSERQRS